MSLSERRKHMCLLKWLRREDSKPNKMSDVPPREQTARMADLIQRVKEYIQKMQTPAPPVLYYSSRDDRWDTFDTWLRSNKHNGTFREIILTEIRKRGMSSVEFYRAANLDRKLFSRMINHPKYQPSKRTAVMCCLALKLDIRQTEHVLQLAGYALSTTLHEDLAVRYCVQHGIYDAMDVMEVMEAVQAHEEEALP